MTDTSTLLKDIAALRQRLEAVRGLVNSDGPVPGTPLDPIRALERQVAAAGRHDLLWEGSLRQMAAPIPESPLPTQLTARARALLERGQDLLGQLRRLAEQFALAGVPGPEPASAGGVLDPLTVRYRETVAMTEVALRVVQAFPDSAAVQLHLCDGLAGVLDVVAERIAGLANLANRQRRDDGWLDRLADRLEGLESGQSPDLKAFVELAEAILADAQEAAPLRFFEQGPDRPARLIAAHSLNVAQVAARITRQDPDLSHPDWQIVLAALVHDVGMLRLSAEILAQAGPLTDAQRRSVEAHTQHGAELAARLLPDEGWLAEAAADHHERLDGTGYPAGLIDQQIAPLPRLLAVCDVYAALANPRPYRPARETRTALADTLLLADQGALDRRQAERLLKLCFYPVGAVVELADGTLAAVIANHTGRRDLNTPARPVLVLLTDAAGQPLPVARPLDLAQCEGHSIVRSLPTAERREVLGRRFPEFV
jgi:HD-GYP domain-containing protein (c-di-GMP phosphodiesterase class II)